MMKAILKYKQNYACPNLNSQNITSNLQSRSLWQKGFKHACPDQIVHMLIWISAVCIKFKMYDMLCSDNANLQVCKEADMLFAQYAISLI